MEIQKKNKLIGFVILILAVGGFAGFQYYQYQSRDVGLLESSAYRIKGPDTAPVKIVEFLDLQCPACAFGSKYLNELMKQYPDLIQLQVKHFPLRSHPHAEMAAKYNECAGQQGKFWEFP